MLPGDYSVLVPGGEPTSACCAEPESRRPVVGVDGGRVSQVLKSDSQGGGSWDTFRASHVPGHISECATLLYPQFTQLPGKFLCKFVLLFSAQLSPNVKPGSAFQTVQSLKYARLGCWLQSEDLEVELEGCLRPPLEDRPAHYPALDQVPGLVSFFWPVHLPCSMTKTNEFVVGYFHEAKAKGCG